MDSRRLVVWISAGILGFQGATLVLDLLNCTLLSWLWVRQHGIERQAAPQHQPPPAAGRVEQSHPEGVDRLQQASGSRHPTAGLCPSIRPPSSA